MDLGQGWKSILSLIFSILIIFPALSNESSSALFYKLFYPQLNGQEYACKGASSSLHFNQDKKT
ncbi:MAG: hypothetical protein WCG27_12155, partial [Pseudomonadota bacterium]